MDPIEPYVNAIIGMIGIAFPFLLQVVSSFDTKYSNDKIIKLFEEEKVSTAFKYSLYSSLIFVAIWSLNLKPLSCFKNQNESINYFINNSAVILVEINATILVFLFFSYVNKVFIFISPSRLIPYLIKKYQNIEKDEKYFTIIKELFLNYLKTQQTDLTNTISKFFYLAFKNIRNLSIGKPIIYPNEYYDLVYRAIEELALLKEKRNINIEHKTAGSLWLIGDTSSREISEITYNWIWNNLLLALRFNQDDLILHHWENFHQYFSLNLRYIHPNFTTNLDAYQVSNLEDVEKRKKERKKVIEFHLALGALLLYKKRYATLKEIFEYTQSEPPTYELFPNSIFEILSFYVKFSDPYDREYYQLYMNYSFPNARGMNGEKIVKLWICKYLAILYIRNFTLGNKNTNHLSVDELKKGEIKIWINRLKELEDYLVELFTDKTFLNNFNIDYLSPDFFTKREDLNPLKILNNFIVILKKSYKFSLETAEIDPLKVLKFQTITNSLISNKLESLHKINSYASTLEGELDKWYVNGVKTVVERDFLAVDSEAEYLNLNSILAETIIENLSATFSNTFTIKTTTSYLIKPEEIVFSIQKLNVDNSYIIINFGVDLSRLNISSNLTIVSFEEKRLGSQVLYVLKKTDLPTITTLPLDQEIIEKYKLDFINEKLNIYTTNVSLNDVSEEIYKENKGNRSDDDMRKSILLGVFIKAEITWKKNIDVIQISNFSIYSSAELPNSIEDIKPIN